MKTKKDKIKDNIKKLELCHNWSIEKSEKIKWLKMIKREKTKLKK